MSDSVEYKTIKQCFDKLQIALQGDPMSIADKLVARGFISSNVCCNLGSSTRETQARELVVSVMRQVQVNERRYHDFIGLLKGETWLQDITLILCETYETTKSSMLTSASTIDCKSNPCVVHDDKTSSSDAAQVAVPTLYSDSQVQSLIKEFEDRFHDLKCDTLDELEERNVKVKRICWCVLMLPESIKHQHYRYLNQAVGQLNSFVYLSQLFLYLNTYCWSFFNFSLLQHIIEKHGSESLKQAMKQYNQDMELFCKNTTVTQLIKFWPGELEPPPHFSTFQAELNVDPDSCTLEQLGEFRKELCKEAQLSEFALLFWRTKKGSVLITWIVPSELVPSLVMVCHYGQMLMMRHHVVCVSVDGQNIAEMEELVTACKYGDTEMVISLLQFGTDPNTRDTVDGMASLMFASLKGHTDIVELLLSHQADVNAKREDGVTSLMCASQEGHTDIVELLLSHQANVNVKREDGMTSLMFASQKGHTDIVKLLLSHQANVNAKRKDDSTPLMIASQKGHTDIVELLLSHQADVNAKEEDDTTPLMFASHKGHTDIVELLLSHRADVNVQTEYGMTSLRLASQEGHTDIVELLLSHQADVNAKKEDDTTPLMWASYKGHTDIVELLLSHQSDVNAKEEDDTTPLMWASQKGHTDIVELLLSHQADVNAKRVDGVTSLMLATFSNHFEVVQQLLNNNADVNAIHEHGLTALIIASTRGYSRIVHVLLLVGADTSITENETGWTALFFAAKHGHRDVVEMLISYGAQVDIKDKSGSTPYDVSYTFNHQEVTELLEKHSQLVEQRTLTNESKLQVLKTGNYIQSLFKEVDKSLPEKIGRSKIAV